MKVDGSCHCGAITFEAEVNPDGLVICHCTDCQQLSGSAYRANIGAPAGSFRITSGEPKIYVKTADSGRKRLQAFCGNCGSAIYSAAPENTPFYSLRTGTIRQRDQFRPKRRIWCESAISWSEDISSIPQTPRE
jgi:hypothetical protein